MNFGMLNLTHIDWQFLKFFLELVNSFYKAPLLLNHFIIVTQGHGLDKTTQSSCFL